MKFGSAALLILVAAPTSEAFVPFSFGVHRRSLFGDQGALWSTAGDKLKYDRFVASSVKNGVSGDRSKVSNTFQECEQRDEEMKKLAAIETRASAAAYMARYENQTGASVIYSKLQEHGVTVVNGFSGGAVLPLLDQFHEDYPRHAITGLKPIRWITNSNEASAGHIAEGYAKSMPTNGKELPVGVAVATSGPGVTNLITPLQDALCDGVPIVVLCGQAATTAPKDAFQSADAVALTKPCTKWSYQIRSAAEIPMVMDYAFFIARHGRPGPVFVDLPKDLQNQVLTSDLIDGFVSADNPGDERSFARLKPLRRSNGEIFQALLLGTDDKSLSFDVFKDEWDEYKLKPVTHTGQQDAHHDDHHPTNLIYKNLGEDEEGKYDSGKLMVEASLTKEIFNLIRKAKKPVIIAGQGCNDAKDELRSFAENFRIPVTTTLHGLGVFDERNDLALNMLGMHGHPTPNFMVQEADLVLCIGSRFDDRITGRMSDFIPEARVAAVEGRGGVIHVDIRASERAKQVEPTFFVHSTGMMFLQTMNEAAKAHKVYPQTTSWLERKKQLQIDFPVRVPHFSTVSVETIDPHSGKSKIVERTRMSAQSAITKLNNALLASERMDDTIFSTGVGIHQMVAAQLITWTQPRQMLSSGSLGTMGVALGYSIGAKLANGGKIVIAVDGDGSFNMTFTELKTVAEQKIPIKIMIIDNDGQMMVEYWQRLFHDNRLIAVRNSKNPDYSTLAKAFGIKSIYCDAEEDMEKKIDAFLFDDPDEPVLFHVRVERTPCLPLVAPGQPLQDMIMEDVDVEVDKGAAPS